MARIYKGSKCKLQLLLCKSTSSIIEDVAISFYTTDPEYPVTVKGDQVVVSGNIATVTISSTLFNTLESGVISYIVYGTRDGITFMEERQSNYFLRTDTIISNGGSEGDKEEGGSSNKPGSGDTEVIPCKHHTKEIYNVELTDLNDEFQLVIEPDAGYDGLSKVTIAPYALAATNNDIAIMDLVGDWFGRMGSAVAQHMQDYMVESKSLTGFFENDPIGSQYEISSIDSTSNYDMCLFIEGLVGCVNMNAMYSGFYTVPVLKFYADCTDVVYCDNAFNGFNMLADARLTNLGYSFTTPTTLDLTPTRLNNQNMVLFARTLYNFSEGANQHGVTTSYIKGVNTEYRKCFTERGWQCID